MEKENARCVKSNIADFNNTLVDDVVYFKTFLEQINIYHDFVSQKMYSLNSVLDLDCLSF
jgi:hypothetical protein